MRYRPFGRSGMALSTVGLRLSWETFNKNRGTAAALMTAALENGINTFHFDTTDLELLKLAAEVFSIVDRKLLFVGCTAHGRTIDGPATSYELTPLRSRLKGAIKESGLNWLDMLAFERPLSHILPEDSRAFLRSLKEARMLRYACATVDVADMDDVIMSGDFNVIDTRFDLDTSWDKRNLMDKAVASDMCVMARDYFPDAYKKASDLMPQDGKKSWFFKKPENPLTGAGTYAFLHQTPDWTAEELCLSYALHQTAISCVLIEPKTVDQLELLAQVPERHMPSSVPAQIEMARFTEHDPKNRAKA